MLQYPKIPGSKYAQRERCMAFDKCDGSNMRYEWSKKRGWHKFGSRNQMIDTSHPFLGESIPLFLKKYAKQLEEVFRTNKRYKDRDQYTVFCEFFGKESLAGMHKEKDPKDIVLFDIWKFKYGFIGPKDFVKDFGHLEIPKVVYEGVLTGKFADDVRNGVYNVNEGVVCKGGSGGKKDVWMCKIKTYAYMKKLKEVYQDNWQQFWES